jgi:hypothetical protein
MAAKLYANSKLTLMDQENIMRLTELNTPVSQIAKKFNVSRPTIYKVISELTKSETNIMDDLLHKKHLQALNIQRKLNLTINSMQNLQGQSKLTKNEFFSKNQGSNKAMENMDLTQVCYEHIKDTFYYGVFGNFKLVVDKATGYFNATKLCTSGNKPFRQWKVLEKSKHMVEYYQRNWCRNSDTSFLYEVKLQNNDKLNKQVTGQYVPKELILDIASWISIEFYDRCNNIIINYFVKEFQNMDNEALQQKIEEVDSLTENMAKLNLEKEIVLVENSELKEIMLRQEQYMRSLGISLEEVKDQNIELLDNNKGLKKEVKKVQRKLGIAVEDRAPQPEDHGPKDHDRDPAKPDRDESKRERFVLMKRNNDEYYPYYTIRAQDSYTTRRIKNQKVYFPNLMVLLDFKCSPNSKTLYNRIKETLKAKGVTFDGNNIDLEDTQITEQELVEEMKVINEAKRCVGNI